MTELTTEEIKIAREYDLSEHFFNFLDRHLIYPLIENLENIYNKDEIENFEFKLLKDTFMMKFIKEKYLKLNPNEELPIEFKLKDEEINSKLIKLNESTKKTLEILSSKEVQESLKQDKIFNRDYLSKKHNINNEKILELYEFGKFQYNRGDYVMSSDLLNNFRLLSTNQELNLSATWGKLSSEIISFSWLEAKNEMNKLREIIDNRNYQGSTIEQLKLRTWLIHYSLFIFFNGNEENLTNLNELFFSSSYLSTIGASCPWILRYLIVSILVSNDFKKTKELIRAIKIEDYEFRDPFTELIKILFINFNFKDLNENLVKIKILIKTDFFISNLNSEKLISKIYLLILRNILKIFKFLNINEIEEKFNIEKSEILKILQENENEFHFKDNEIISTKNSSNNSVYFQIYEKTKANNFKSTQILNNAFNKDI